MDSTANPQKEFWSNLRRYQRAMFPNDPIFIKGQEGDGVWPSFYDNQLRNNSKEIRRKRIQIVQSGKTHVALFVKKVAYDDFVRAVQPILPEGLSVAPANKTWQGVRVTIPEIDPRRPIEVQLEAVDAMFRAARRLMEFFLAHEETLINIHVTK